MPVSPNSDLSSPVPEHREAMICYVRECLKLTRDLGAPICKIFAAWPGVAVREGLGDYGYTRGIGDVFPDMCTDTPVWHWNSCGGCGSRPIVSPRLSAGVPRPVAGANSPSRLTCRPVFE
jgi:hypothetical protein